MFGVYDQSRVLTMRHSLHQSHQLRIRIRMPSWRKTSSPETFDHKPNELMIPLARAHKRNTVPITRWTSEIVSSISKAVWYESYMHNLLKVAVTNVRSKLNNELLRKVFVSFEAKRV